MSVLGLFLLSLPIADDIAVSKIQKGVDWIITKLLNESDEDIASVQNTGVLKTFFFVHKSSIAY